MTSVENWKNGHYNIHHECTWTLSHTVYDLSVLARVRLCVCKSACVCARVCVYVYVNVLRA